MSNPAPLMNTRPQPVLPADETLTFSSGVIQAYANCPRQFYYQHLIKLPSPSHDSAHWGRLWHSIMEVFHKDPHPSPALLTQLVAEVTRQQPRPPDRWPPRALGWMDNLPALQQRDIALKLQRVCDSLLNQPDLLLTVSTASGAQVEKAVHLTLPDANTRFHLRMDLAFPSSGYHWHIVDYKTYGRSKFSSKKTDTLIQHLMHALNHFPQRDTAAPHREQFPYPSAKPLIAQVPLYGLAMQQAGWPASTFALHILRPEDQGGCAHVAAELNTALLDAFANALTGWIQHQLRPTTRFEPVPEGNPCDLCAFTSICPKAADDPAKPNSLTFRGHRTLATG